MRSLRRAVALALLLPPLAVADPTAAPPAEPPVAAAPAPNAIPDDLPLYAGAIPVSSMTSQQRGTIVNLRSSDAPDRIFEWYRAELPRRGWLVEKQDGAGAQHLVTAYKGGRKASLLISARPAAEDDAKTEAQILLVVTEDE